MTKEETRLIVACLTIQSAYQSVDNGESWQSFMEWISKTHDTQKLCLSFDGIHRLADHAYERALSDKNDPSKDWDELFCEVVDGEGGASVADIIEQSLI
jgi:hypothetical protein